MVDIYSNDNSYSDKDFLPPDTVTYIAKGDDKDRPNMKMFLLSSQIIDFDCLPSAVWHWSPEYPAAQLQLQTTQWTMMEIVSVNKHVKYYVLGS